MKCSAAIARKNPETVTTDEARLGCHRPSTGRCRTQEPHQRVFKSIAGGLLEKKVRLNFKLSGRQRQVVRPTLARLIHTMLNKGEEYTDQGPVRVKPV